ncbi:MAG: NAD(P)/FAD-dependent oxidoreductase [Verrucomicrobiaceae bacterium]|nr:MAG: NAD(P)/FAD-dependent oxidoreductase [Verrucomicrobiaceae bacterium]
MKVHHRNLPRIVVIGGGFGGLSVAKALARDNVRVTLLDRQNHHLFQPLLYQVATAALSPADIAEPLRHILRQQDNVEVIMTDAQRVDVEGKKVITGDGEVEYDHLVIAAGARHSYFGKPEWEKFAPGLKSLDDALEIRRRLLLAFEIAEKTDDAEQRQAALTFVVVGAGPTGVEMAGAIAEIARVTLVQDFRHIDPSQARVILLDATARVLPVYTEGLSESAKRQLEKIGVDVRLQAIVEELGEDGVHLKNGEFIAARTVIWAAGNAAAPLGTTLGVPLDRQGRVIVNSDLTVPGHPEIQVIGDMAHFVEEDGKPLPGLSPVAMQQGRHAARNIRAQLAGGWTARFHYFDKGTMATIGRHAAIADVRGLQFSGLIAWLAWLFVHLIFLISFRNKMMVFLNWAYIYLTFGRHARLITGREWAENRPKPMIVHITPKPALAGVPQ